MPTADNFEDARDGLNRLSTELDTFTQPLQNRMGADVMEGGELTDSTYESIKHTRATALTLSAIITEYAAECERRREQAVAAAKAQEQYEEDLEDYERDLDIYENHDGERDGIEVDEKPVKPTPPPAPPDYIDI